MSLAEHYTRFQVSSRLLLTGHSHQAWPDVARDAQLAAFDAAASLVDGKWGEAFAKADRVREHFRTLLSDPGGDIALGQNTHELVIRFLSALDLRARPRLVTTDGEFHTLRRQLSRLAEAGLEVVRVPAAPADTLAARLASEVDDRTAAVMVSSVLFETSRIVPDLGELMAASAKVGAELLVDAYHALGVVPFPLDRQGLADAWIVGGGYKYLQLGEGNCFLRLPAHAQSLRPVLTGWFAEFDTLAAERDPSHVDYAPGAHRFAGSTYDPTSHYRAARVADFFAEQGLTDAVLREISLRQTTLLATEFDALDLPPEVITRDRDLPRTSYGGFLALRSPRAAELQSALRERGVLTDNRGEHLRFGPAPYLTDDQLRSAMAVLKEVC
ncbi:kynureninase [Actinokineospora sp. UTMC 2448]|uniref:kynureninase/PvdN C-terminal domain-containing protein n=1 Tax=Actinokineospora sp. UTMC 2448 TaxID=2268449 RepID=UPI00216469EE|nr:kynureninase [Actinokineospora sp. UTMC 2448]UVS78358.1 Kynureninase [Actinokineospora sp. UTMC 2448]